MATRAEMGGEPKNWMEARSRETGELSKHEEQFDRYLKILELAHMGDEADRMRKEYKE